MVAHDFIVKNREGELRYQLFFNKHHPETITLPAPALFDHVARGGYRIMPADIIAYRNAQAAAEAEEEPQQWDEWMPAPQHPYYHPDY